MHISPDRADEGHADGAVNWELARIRLVDHLSMTVAGEHAMLRWLRNHHLDTPTNIMTPGSAGCTT